MHKQLQRGADARNHASQKWTNAGWPFDEPPFARPPPSISTPLSTAVAEWEQRPGGLCVVCSLWKVTRIVCCLCFVPRLFVLSSACVFVAALFWSSLG